MTEEELAKQLRAYQELKKQDKNIDVAALALAAFANHQANLLTAKEKRVAYLVSLAFPPFGLIFAVKFWFSDKDDGQHAAVMCVALTAATIILFVVLTNLMFAGSGLSVDQLKQAPQQYQDILQP